VDPPAEWLATLCLAGLTLSEAAQKKWRQMGIPLRVLMVEDSEDDATLLLRELRLGGYDATFERVDTPTAMSAAIDGKQWDLVICDYSMPNFSGAAALKLLRGKGVDVPFIFLSGTIGEDTAVAALKQGAQDYIMKDNLKRLLPAIRRELDEAEQKRERRRLERQVQQLQKFEAIGVLAGGIAHDFNNALGVILGWAQLAYAELPEASLTRLKLQMIREQAESTARLTKQLLAFARRQVLQPQNLDLNEVVTQTKQLLQSVIGDQIEFNLKLAPDRQIVRADASQVEQVLMNLCLNARDAMPDGGRLVLTTGSVEIGEDFCRMHSYGSPGPYVLLEVSDTGLGMDAATLDRIFEPFFTTKEMGRGTGLGLATVYGIVKQHGGFVNVYSEPGQGTTFRVYFPLGAGVLERPRPAVAGEIRSGTETILVADDHEQLREMARHTLTAQGYRVIPAKNGQEAVNLFMTNSTEIRLVVLDVSMPLLNGRDAYTKMQAIAPDLPVIFTSGHSAESASLESNIQQGAAFLQKPYDLETLRRAVRNTLDTKSS
jgi:two-component system, cell cycle sensor histidine kinase and response regulator CckA